MTESTLSFEHLIGHSLVATLERRFDTVISEVEVGDKKFNILRPRNADDLIREEDFVMDERLPYWADIWPSSTILAEQIMKRSGKGRMLELGCGVGLVTTAAMSIGYDVLASDYYTDALAFTRANSFMNLGYSCRAEMINWRRFPADIKGFDVVTASDVLYESEYARLMPRILKQALTLHGVGLIADPGRIAAPEFIEHCEKNNLEILSDEVYPFEAGEIKQQITIYEIGRTS
ncbi:MAG TPA: methyltransferase domain-containing protein [Gemmatimonadaceae bacterium]|nr:methyltransferase domain-containing protein [Gemmatimonadaceae bacterium]